MAMVLESWCNENTAMPLVTVSAFVLSSILYTDGWVEGETSDP